MNPEKTTVTVERVRQLELAAETEVAAQEKMLSTKSASKPVGLTSL